MGGIEKKYCSVCDSWLELGAFYYHASRWDKRATPCKVCSNANNRRWRKTNKERCGQYEQSRRGAKNEHCRRYKTRHRERVNLAKRLRRYWRLQSDSKYRIVRRISASINKTLNGRKNGKSWQELVGYNCQQLMEYLEKQFRPGMTWDNYGEWHIDHKIPISAFNFTDVNHVDFKRCWDLKNLQPLWAEENIKKSNKLERPFQPGLLI